MNEGTGQSSAQAYREWLVIRCQQGETEAFTALVKAWHGRLIAYARTRLGQSEAAADVTQETWLAINHGISGLKDPGSFSKWSLRILERRCSDWMRRHYRQHDHEKDSLDRIDPALAASGSAETEIDVARILAILDGRLQVVVRLYYLEQLSLVEISDVLDIPTGTVKSRLFYARKLISDKLQLEKDNEQT